MSSLLFSLAFRVQTQLNCYEVGVNLFVAVYHPVTASPRSALSCSIDHGTISERRQSVGGGGQMEHVCILRLRQLESVGTVNIEACLARADPSRRVASIFFFIQAWLPLLCTSTIVT